MSVRAFVAASVLVLPLAALAERLPMQSDVDRCALNAQDKGSSSLQGKVRMQILVRKDGQVYAAFAHSTKGIDDRPMLRCIANNALLWKYQPASTDSWAPFPLAFTTAGQDASGMTSSLGLHAAQTAPQVFLPERHPKVDPADLDEKLAQETLDVLPDVTSAEHGLAMAAVHKVPEAMADFSAALAKDPNDVLALRGKAELIAETHGDLNEAAGLVHRLVEAAPNSMFGPEASIYVCAALKNDLCVVDAWRALTTSAEVHSAVVDHTELARKPVLDECQALAEISAARLNAARQNGTAGAPAAGGPAGAPAAPADPCAGEQGEDRQALCEVKRCFDEGSLAYAKELSVNGLEYKPGDWRLKPVGAGKLLVTRPISGAAKMGDAAPPGHDAMWLVKVGENLSIMPSTADARQITVEHNACKKK